MNAKQRTQVATLIEREFPPGTRVVYDGCNDFYCQPRQLGDVPHKVRILRVPRGVRTVLVHPNHLQRV